MTNTIRIKRRASGGAAGAPSTLKTSEVAYNEVDDTIYIGFGDDGSGNATSIRAVAGAGSFVGLSGTQTVTGAKDFSTAVPTISAAIAGSDNSTKIATTAWVKALAYLTGNQTITLTGDVTGSGATSIATTLAASGVGAGGTYTKVTVDSKGRVTVGALLVAGDIPTITTSQISDFTTAAQALIDASVMGLSWKASVRVAASTNITISGPGAAIDGVTLANGDRVLLKAQTAGAQNGIYVFNGAAVAMTRSTDADTAAEVTGAATMIREGTSADQQWVQTADSITLGTTALVWAQIGSSSGGVTSVVNNGTGQAVGMNVTGSTLNLRTIIGSGNILATQNTNDITLTLTGTIAYALGGTGVDLGTLTTGALLKKGASAVAAAVLDTDYIGPSSTINGGTF